MGIYSGCPPIQISLLCFLLVKATIVSSSAHSSYVWRKEAPPSHAILSNQCSDEDGARAPAEPHETWGKELCLGCLGKKFLLAFLEATWRDGVLCLDLNMDASSRGSCWQPRYEDRASKWRWCQDSGKKDGKRFFGIKWVSLSIKCHLRQAQPGICVIGAIKFNF